MASILYQPQWLKLVLLFPGTQIFVLHYIYLLAWRLEYKFTFPGDLDIWRTKVFHNMAFEADKLYGTEDENATIYIPHIFF